MIDMYYECDTCGGARPREEVTLTKSGRCICDDCKPFVATTEPPVPTGRCANASCGKTLTPRKDPAASVQWHCVDERTYCSVFCFMGDGACPCRRSHCE